MKIKTIHITGLACAAALAASCENFLDIKAPRNQLVTASVFANDALADGAINGIYYELINNSSGFAAGNSNGVGALLDIYTDQLDFGGSDVGRLDMASGSVLADATPVLNVWASAYKAIFRANEALEGLAMSTSVSDELAQQLRGEALFVRAFAHVYLTGLFGDVPLITESAYQVTSLLPRSPQSDVYGQIRDDLVAAVDLLPTDDAHAGGERLRPTRWAAHALLARVSLYLGDWQRAVDDASAVIGHTDRFALATDPDGVFLTDSREAIWQLRPVAQAQGTWEAYDAIPVAGSALPPNYSLSASLLDAFETGDKRESAWIGWFTPLTSDGAYSYPLKYRLRIKGVTEPYREYTTVLRLAELYLIRAEARAQLGDLAGAWGDINAVRRNHGGLPDLPQGATDELMAAVERERRIEFFHEWGHRFFDLRRWGKMDAVLGAVKPGWKPTNKWLPIPQKEREANPFLMQNDGY